MVTASLAEPVASLETVQDVLQLRIKHKPRARMALLSNNTGLLMMPDRLKDIARRARRESGVEVKVFYR
jgi:hypothetical protein